MNRGAGCSPLDFAWRAVARASRRAISCLDMTADDARLIADPLVVRAWVTGWALARETPPPVPEAGGLRVDVGWPRERIRYVFAGCSEGLRKLAKTVVEPWIFLKVSAPPQPMRALLPSRWLIQPLGYMMARDSSTGESTPVLPEGYAFETVDGGVVATVRIRAAQGDVAAIGRVALTGDFAVYDRIETDSLHRRRGLGRALVRALQGMAFARGNTRGVLVATADGRALYETLDWRLHSLYTTAVIPGPDPSACGETTADPLSPPPN